MQIIIRTDNAAFEGAGGRYEVGRILRDLAEKVERGDALPLDLRDVNGNRVGVARGRLD